MFTLNKKQQTFPCPVCGYGLRYPAADFNICPSCGVEFGYETAGRSYDNLRKEWVHTGGHWASPVFPKPKEWDPWIQLINAGYGDDVPFRLNIGLEQEEVTAPIEIWVIGKAGYLTQQGKFDFNFTSVPIEVAAKGALEPA